MKYKGIVFDLDGTLLNTIDDLGDSVNAVLNKYGYPVFEIEEYKMKVGNGFRKLIINSFPKDHQSDKEIDDAVREFSLEYEKRYLNKTKPYPGIKKILNELQNDGYLLAINSNKRTDYSNKMIEHYFPEINWIANFGERKGIPKKPDPTSLNQIIKMMNLNRTKVIYVGDSKPDMLTASNAEIASIGCDWGFRGEKELRKYNATYIAYEAADILKIVK